MASGPDGGRPLVAGPDSGPVPPFPLQLDGKVIKGFGRGSSDLGIPTANIPISGLSVGGHEDVSSGVYYGWAGISACKATQQHSASSDNYTLTSVKEALSQLNSSTATHPPNEDKGRVYPMVMSIGWNPFYKNTVRSVEVHLMHHFATDFYGSHMNLIILGFIRPELDYVSKEKLIEDIKTDIDVAVRSLAREPYAKFRAEGYLLDFEGKGEVGT